MDTSYKSEDKYSIKLLHQDDLTHKIDPLQIISNFEDEVRYNIENRINDMRPPIMLFVIWVVFVILFSIGISIAVIANFLSIIFDTVLIVAYPNIILQVVAVVFGMMGVWFSIASFIVTYRVIKYRYHPKGSELFFERLQKNGKTYVGVVTNLENNHYTAIEYKFTVKAQEWTDTYYLFSKNNVSIGDKVVIFYVPPISILL